jgi:hypothetical protein
MVLIQRFNTGNMFSWTWFFPFTNQLSFVHPETVRSHERYKLAQMIWFRRDDNGRVETDRRMTIITCDQRVFTTVDKDDKGFKQRIFRTDGGPMMKWWIEMTEPMKAYFCNS